MYQVFTPVLCALALTVALAAPNRALAIDACSSAPCLNGGVCSLVGFNGYSCACPTGFLGPSCSLTAAGDEYVEAEYDGDRLEFSNLIGWYQFASGLGQTFRTGSGGLLKRISFLVIARQEAVNEAEALVIDFWKLGGDGQPAAPALATRSVAAADVSITEQVFKSVDFSADNIVLAPNSDYAFTMSVVNKADTDSQGMYGTGHNVSAAGYANGHGLSYSGVNPWFGSDGYSDLSSFEVTVIRPMFENGFEAVSP